MSTATRDAIFDTNPKTYRLTVTMDSHPTVTRDFDFDVTLEYDCAGAGINLLPIDHMFVSVAQGPETSAIQVSNTIEAISGAPADACGDYSITYDSSFPFTDPAFTISDTVASL